MALAIPGTTGNPDTNCYDMSQSIQLHTFHGGLKLDGHKAISTSHPIKTAELPATLLLPVQQHIGQPADVIVKPGEQVFKGQKLTRASDYISAPIHAPTSGIISAVEERLVPHPSGLKALCIEIQTDGKDKWGEKVSYPDFRNTDIVTLRNHIRESGIVGLGGAAFPTSVKLNPGRSIDTLILNGAECEPYITCDDMLMREHAADIVEGMAIMQFMLSAEQCIIGIEDNKPEAIAAMRAAVKESELAAEVVAIPTIYPTGGEKQLIKILTNQEVPGDSLPADIGIVCQNVGTAKAVYDAVIHGQPLIDRVITVTGEGIAQPQNFLALIGTSMAELVAQAGGYKPGVKRLIMGGSMMGFALATDEIPIIKASNCILALTEVEQPPAQPCIRCGKCEQVCPALLLPQQLFWYAQAKDFDKIQDYHLFDCIECGCCAEVCPSHIPLVQYYRFAKTEIWNQEREKVKSDIARERHIFHEERLERLKKEKAERLAKKKAALKNRPKVGDAEAKKSEIEAALARVKAKKEKQTTTQKNIER